MRLALLLCACVCEHAPPKRETVTVTLQSITMYDVWLWEQSGDYDEGYTWAEPEPAELFGPEYYYPEDDEPADEAGDIEASHSP